MNDMTTPKLYTATVSFPQWVIEYFKNTSEERLHLFHGSINRNMHALQGECRQFIKLISTCYDFQLPIEKDAFKKEWLTDIREVVEKPVEPEMFDWLTAMKLFADGVEIEVRYPSEWWKLDADPGCVCFDKQRLYRRKPTPSPITPPEPDWDALALIVIRGEDVKVQVKDHEESNWFNRYFSHRGDGRFYVFDNGSTKWSAGNGSYNSWRYCRLWEEGRK